MSRYHLKDGEADFAHFLATWNRMEGRNTPELHIKIAKWLERAWIRKETKLLLQAFRSSGKSTIAALFAAWLLYTNADLRILVLSADIALAKKMARQTLKIIERHPHTQKMKPDERDQWAGDRFTVRRMTQLRDPSMLARGVTANITGSRADVIICDDVEVPRTCDSAEKRAALRERLQEMNYVLVPGGTVLYIGTPHTYYSIYADKPRVDAGEEKIFLEGYGRQTIPLLDAEGNSAWPEKFTPYAIDQIKRQSGPNKFASQMMLQPVSAANGRLDPDLMRIYGHELEYSKELNALFLGPNKMAAASAWWDPAYGSPRGDKSVFAILFVGENGNYYLHRVIYIKVPDNPDIDRAAYQCDVVAQAAKDNYLISVTVENNGLGRFMWNALRAAASRARANVGIVEKSNTKSKESRILEALDAPLAAGKIFVHKSVVETSFISEMREWRPYTKGLRDDGLDAVAGAIAQAPFTLVNLHERGPGPSWHAAAKVHQARTEFEA